MSKFEEKKYKQTLIDDTPDLWAKIDGKLDKALFISDSAPDMDMTPKKDKTQSKNTVTAFEKGKLKPSKVYKIAGLVAACLAIIIIPITIKSTNRTKEAELTKDAFSDTILSDSNNNGENDVDSFDATDNSTSEQSDAPLFNSSDNDVSSKDSKNPSNSKQNIGDHTNKDNATKNDKTDSYNHNEGEIKLPSNENQGSSNSAESYDSGGMSPLSEGGEHLKNGQIHFRIDSTLDDPKLGLIYKGMATASKDRTISAQCVFYLSLRELSKKDLSKKINIGDKITITLKDTSYASCPDKPYYAASIMYK